MSNDDTRYRIIRGHAGRPLAAITLQLAPEARKAVSEYSPQDPSFVRLILVSFGGHEIVVELGGIEVGLVLPGSLRLVGSREEMRALVAALLEDA